ncbi:unnamed protein product, partial [marine sediment metagenome]
PGITIVEKKRTQKIKSRPLKSKQEKLNAAKQAKNIPPQVPIVVTINVLTVHLKKG